MIKFDSFVVRKVIFE